jgi:hypothetical protein
MTGERELAEGRKKKSRGGGRREMRGFSKGRARILRDNVNREEVGRREQGTYKNCYHSL